MKNEELLSWLLEGDVSIQYQTQRDLFHKEKASLKKRISTEGWGAKLLSCRKANGHWGRGFYLPKWTSTHYTLMDLKNLGISKEIKEIRNSVELILDSERDIRGGINYSYRKSDVCINGMILNFAAYFMGDHKRLYDIIDFLLNVEMEDGGWNCRYLNGAVHSSLHSTISVLEGLSECLQQGVIYRRFEINKMIKEGVEFLLQHKLYKSHRTGKIIDPRMLRFSYPSRWRYDILRALDYFQKTKTNYDPRMEDALKFLMMKQRPDGRWNLQEKHNGEVHFDMEKPGQPSRWNTLRAMRVLEYFEKEYSAI